MQLAAWQSSPAEYHPIRDLTEDELSCHEHFQEPFSDAENRFTLFRILELNHRDWISYLHSLLSVGAKQKIDNRLRLNQLILNYLTVSYAITQHFQKSYMQKFRKNKQKLDEYDAFLDRLQKGCWAFCFFQDFRNYVQHCELPIGAFSRRESHTKVELSITHDAEILLRDYRDWGKSKLTKERGTLNLVDLLEHYHVRLIRDYASFVAKAFYPLLGQAHEFYATLTKEVHQVRPGYRMVFGSVSSKPNPDGTTELNMECLQVPNDVYAELGIERE